MRKAFDIEDLESRRPHRHGDGRSAGHDRRRGGVPRASTSAISSWPTSSSARTSRWRSRRSISASVIDYFNKAAADLPDPARLKTSKLPGATVVLDGKGGRFAELFASDQRRVWMPLSDIPELVQQAFISAEDKRFYRAQGHRRALAHPGVHRQSGAVRPAAGRLDHHPAGREEPAGRRRPDLRAQDPRDDPRPPGSSMCSPRREILELYLNSIYLGRSSWGVEMAARSYFGKSVNALSLGEGALLAALTKGPTYFSPDRHPERAQERLAYVLERMQEDGAISAGETKQAQIRCRRSSPYTNPRRDTGFHFVDQLAREAKAGRRRSTRSRRISLHGPLDHPAASCSGRPRPRCRRASRATRSTPAGCRSRARRRTWPMPSRSCRLIQSQMRGSQQTPAGLAAGAPQARGCRSTTCIGRPRSSRQGAAGAVMGSMSALPTDAICRLRARPPHSQRSLKLVRRRFRPFAPRRRKGRSIAGGNARAPVGAGRGAGARQQDRPHPGDEPADSRIRSASSTGRPNRSASRVRRSSRSPISRPCRRGCSPTRIVRDEEITLPPIGGMASTRDQDYWTPKNYDRSACGVVTLRRALENSRNLATANLLDGGIDADPAAQSRPGLRPSRSRRRSIANACPIIRSCWARSRCG